MQLAARQNILKLKREVSGKTRSQDWQEIRAKHKYHGIFYDFEEISRQINFIQSFHGKTLIDNCCSLQDLPEKN